MEVRNAILVLNKIMPVFPSSADGISQLLGVAGSLEKEKRSDLKQMGKSYFKKLSKRKEIEWPKTVGSPAATDDMKVSVAHRRAIGSDKEPVAGDACSQDKAPRRAGVRRTDGGHRQERRRKGDGVKRRVDRDGGKGRGERDTRVRSIDRGKSLESGKGRRKRDEGDRSSRESRRKSDAIANGRGDASRCRDVGISVGVTNRPSSRQRVEGGRPSGNSRRALEDRPSSPREGSKSATHRLRKGSGVDRRSPSEEKGRACVTGTSRRRDRGRSRVADRSRGRRDRERIRDHPKTDADRDSRKRIQGGGGSRDSGRRGQRYVGERNGRRSNSNRNNDEPLDIDVSRVKGRSSKGHKRGRDGERDRRERKRRR